ncbi:probable phytol kinase 1, chloroplastic isoform X2 [Cicer arietinum]|uniref:probable phytol kinase 1, chloroplastic isoform X2 n=1 Tax=Cicer arietinum TaxID=3827 RepID=UPI003CC635C9
MTLLSSRLFPSPSVNHRPPAQSTTTRHLPWIKLTRTNDTVRFLCSPAIIKPVIRLDERFVARFVVPENAQDLIHNGGATIGVLGGAYALVFAFDDFTRKNILNQGLSRKLVHILSGLLFLVSWPIFRELLRGPLYYVVILMLCAVVFWRDSPIGVVSLAMMCGGDGVADIIGRRYGSMKIPYNQKKSWAGSISMLIFGFLVSIGMLYYYSALGHVQFDWWNIVPRVALVSIVATVVESLPITDVVDDNISVPLATIAVAFFTFHH